VTGEPQKGMRRKAKACRKVVTAAEDAQQVAVKAQKIAAAIKPAATKIVEEMKDLPVRIKAYKQ
jgi:hypothetical protein